MNWITDRFPEHADGITLQYIGPVTSASDTPRTIEEEYVINAPGMIHYQTRCWIPVPDVLDNPPSFFTGIN